MCGLYSGEIQKRLLAIPDDLPLKKALDLTLAYEAADKSMKDMHMGHSGEDPSVDKVSSWFPQVLLSL